MEQSPSCETNRSAAYEEIPHLFWNCKVHFCLPCVPIPSHIKPFHSTQPTSWWSILILSSHLSLSLSSGVFLWDVPTKTLHACLLSPIRATCLAYLTPLDFIFQIFFGKDCTSRMSSFCSFLHFPFTLSVLGGIIFLITIFLNIPSLYFFLKLRYQVSHQYKTTGKFIVYCILIFIFLDSKLWEKRFCTE